MGRRHGGPSRIDIAICRVWRRAAAVPGWPRARSRTSMGAAATGVRHGRRSSRGNRGRAWTARHLARAWLAGVTHCGSRPCDVFHRTRAVVARRAQTDRHDARTTSVRDSAVSGSCRHTDAGAVAFAGCISRAIRLEMDDSGERPRRNRRGHRG